jgi:hypothetical protein
MMKHTNKIRHLTFGMAAAAVALGLPQRATAEVSDADFNALKAMVQQLGDQVRGLQQTNQLNQQTHAQDVQQIKELQAKLATTQQTAETAEQKSDAVAEAQAKPALPGPIDEATVNHNFMILGDAEVQYVNADKQNGSFEMADFAPIFLYRGGDNILFEAGFDTTLQNSSNDAGTHDSGASTSFDLSFAQLDYVMNDYLTFCAGDVLLPLGTYSERSAGWLNKIPDDPLGVDLIPGSGVGAELRGAVPLGESGSLLNYAIYGVNGVSSTDTNGAAGNLDVGGNVGVLNINSSGTTANLHRNPAGGARLGVFFPIPYKPHYDFEMGISAFSGEWDDAGNHLYTAGVLDAALHLGPNFEAKGEYIVDQYGSDDLGNVHQSGWWLQSSYKLAGLGLELPGINDLELVGRYDWEDNGQGTTTDRYTAGYIYYLTNALLFEGDYEFINSNDPTVPATQLILQLSYGF